MKVMICEGTPKEIADLLKDLKGQPELMVDCKELAKAISDDSCENRLSTIHRRIPQD